MSYPSINEMVQAVKDFLYDGWNTLADTDRDLLLRLKKNIPDTIEDIPTEEDE